MQDRADNRVAIVTAAGSGLGAGAARALAARGWRLVLFGRSERVEAVAGELGAIAVRGDIAQAADLQRLTERVLAEHGRVDAAVISTGHAAKGELTAIADESWHAGLDLLLMPVVRLARSLLPVFERQGSGAVVAVSSYAAVEPDPMFPLSSAFRAALSSYVKMFARAHAGRNIRMNAVLPGFIDSFPVVPEIVQRIPAGRYGRVEELAQTIAFLLSDEAGYITGENLLVDGGLSKGI